uniref:Alpha-2-macroglobulin bait region domain-containing protein n=1 Tax=Astyanax mexicanus TaxID=7994 RepID=A0A8B9KUB5_ASTMX
MVTLEDNNGNRIGQWMNVSSTGLILQLSHQLNSEAPEGVYKLEAKTGYMSTFHYFTVKKYVLTRFEITVKAPKEQSVAEEELKIEVCGKYTYGQPVPGEALLEVCWNFLQPYYTDVQLIIPCLSENIKDGCASHVFNMSLFSNSEFEHNFRDSLDINVVMTEEGTGISMVKSERTSVTYESGKAEFLDLPKNFERDTVIEGKIKVVTYGGEPIRNKEVYLLKGPIWSPTLLLNLTTNDDGLAKFAVDAPAEPETEILLLASVYLGNQYQGYRKPFFRHSDARIQVLQPATPYSPVYSEISIESLEEPIKCDSEVSVNLKYYIISESTKNYSTDLIYTVISRGAIVHHGYKKVEVKESKRLIEGRVSFKLSVVPEMAPVVQVLVYGVLPSENVIAASRGFIVDKCFTNKVSLQFSPTEAVPGEENSLQLSALPGSLCALSAVDQSVFILEPGKRLNADTVFRLLPLKSIYYHVVEDQPECLHVRPRRASTSDYAYDSIKSVGLKMVTNLVVREPQCLIYKGVQYLRISYLIDGHVYALTADYSAQSSSEPLQTVRSFFPETWIWQLVEVGSARCSAYLISDMYTSGDCSKTAREAQLPLKYKETHSFEVNQNNKLLYQEKSLQNVPGKYSVLVNGTTCASVQIALFYNVPTLTVPTTLSVKNEVGGNLIFFLLFPLRYDGVLNYTNMAIVDIKLLSGFTADPTFLTYFPLVERVDSKNDHVLMYLKELPQNTPVTYQLHIKQVLPVKNLKPAVIKVYDYYQPSDQSETEYSSPCV